MKTNIFDWITLLSNVVIYAMVPLLVVIWRYVHTAATTAHTVSTITTGDLHAILMRLEWIESKLDKQNGQLAHHLEWHSEVAK